LARPGSSRRRREPAEHDARHRREDHGLAGLGQALEVAREAARGQALEVAREAARLAEPREGPLNDLIANDKFCLTRILRLRLSWS
jgi:hypothetical protein